MPPEKTSAEFTNAYVDEERARAYAALDFAGTYYLAARDLPALISQHVAGRDALDFGCGAGRSTRLLRGIGFRVVGIDVSAPMIQLARDADPAGSYRLIADGDLEEFSPGSFDLVLSSFAFDNIAGISWRCELLSRLGRLLREDGRLVLIGSTPNVYVNEWLSFSTVDFPENRTAASGDVVRVVIKDGPDRRPVDDLLWHHADYLSLFESAGLELVAHHTPLGTEHDGYPWLAESSVAPWVIYVLGRR